jgi:TRAP-type transport system small permease protein
MESNLLRKMRRVLHGLIGAVTWISRISLGLMALTVIVNVVGRYLFRLPLKGSVEVVQLLLLITVYFAIPYTEVRNAHVTMDEVVGHFPRRLRSVLMSIMYFGAAAFILIMGWRSWILAVQHTRPEMRMTDVLHLPIAPAVFVMAAGLVLFGLELLLNGFSPPPLQDERK